jgi:hypothetical protein
MDTFLLTNDSYFKNFLQDQNEETIRIMGWKFTSREVIFMTLFYLEEKLQEYLANEYVDFPISKNQCQEVLTLEVARYLNAMQNDEIRELYHTFIHKEELITDLMLLNRIERIGLLEELLDWNPSDLHRINLITAN